MRESFPTNSVSLRLYEGPKFTIPIIIKLHAKFCQDWEDSFLETHIEQSQELIKDTMIVILHAFKFRRDLQVSTSWRQRRRTRLVSILNERNEMERSCDGLRDSILWLLFSHPPLDIFSQLIPCLFSPWSYRKFLLLVHTNGTFLVHSAN